MPRTERLMKISLQPQEDSVQINRSNLEPIGYLRVEIEIEIETKIRIEMETVRANSTLLGIEIEIEEGREEAREIEKGTEIATWRVGTTPMTRSNRTETVTGKRRGRIIDL